MCSRPAVRGLRCTIGESRLEEAELGGGYRKKCVWAWSCNMTTNLSNGILIAGTCDRNKSSPLHLRSMKSHIMTLCGRDLGWKPPHIVAAKLDPIRALLVGAPSCAGMEE